MESTCRRCVYHLAAVIYTASLFVLCDFRNLAVNAIEKRLLTASIPFILTAECAMGWIFEALFLSLKSQNDSLVRVEGRVLMWLRRFKKQLHLLLEFYLPPLLTITIMSCELHWPPPHMRLIVLACILFHVMFSVFFP